MCILVHILLFCVQYFVLSRGLISHEKYAIFVTILLSRAHDVTAHASSGNPNAPTPAPSVANIPNCSEIEAARGRQPVVGPGEQAAVFGLLPVLGIMSVLGGVISFVVLMQRSMRSPPNK